MKQITKVFSVGLAVLMLAGSLNCGVEAFAYAPEYGITYQKGQYRRTYTGKKMSYPKMSVIVSQHGRTSTVKNAKLISVSGNKSGKAINGYTTKYTYKLPNGKKITASKNWWIIPKNDYKKGDLRVKTSQDDDYVHSGVTEIYLPYRSQGKYTYHISSYNNSGKCIGERTYKMSRTDGLNAERTPNTKVPCCFGEPTTFKVVTCKEVKKRSGNKVSTIHIKSNPFVFKATMNFEPPSVKVKQRFVLLSTCGCSAIQVQYYDYKKKKYSMKTISAKQFREIENECKGSSYVPIAILSKDRHYSVRVREFSYSKYQKKNVYTKWSNTVK